MLRLIGSVIGLAFLLVACGGGGGGSDGPGQPAITAGSPPAGATGIDYPGYTFTVERWCVAVHLVRNRGVAAGTGPELGGTTHRNSRDRRCLRVHGHGRRLVESSAQRNPTREPQDRSIAAGAHPGSNAARGHPWHGLLFPIRGNGRSLAHHFQSDARRGATGS